MRKNFDQQLELLNEELTDMGGLCESAISSAVKALFDADGEYVQAAKTQEEEIDRKERDIENLCMKLLLQQQPVAKDLRVISSALKMISDMERIGDQASDIAQITKFIEGRDVESKLHIKEMAKATIKMVTDAIESFVNKDLKLASAVIEYDDVVDGLFGKVKDELIGLIGQNKSDGEFCIDLLMIAKYLERIGDHAVNIAEWVVYSITANHVNHADFAEE